ncbi:MAG: CoA ligase [Bacteroidetes bacterium]|nr:MAG: CoA ligase [Bacteroidota bacterium]
MINKKLINPKSIVVVGGSNDVRKPGGKVLKNLLDGDYPGKLYVVNPKEKEVQGLPCYASVDEIPQADMAILAIAAKYCPPTVEVLTAKKETQAFIIISAGFSEENAEGAALEKKVVELIERVDGSLIGPNCVGMFNTHFHGVFSTPIPRIDPQGVDFISGSGATAVFIMEAGISMGLTFNSLYSVGNSAQLGVEDILEHLDNTYEHGVSSPVKLLYIESVNKPQKLLRHARSLIQKGAKIAAIKAGSSEAGTRAASSHTGAMASPDVAVDTLFRKAGIVRCYGREELATVASIFMHKELKGKNIAIITHAGGPAVMLTDTLSNGGLNIPHIEAPELLEKLFPGSSVANPIDFLATGTAEQLGEIIDYCDNHLEGIDGMAVIFGSPGLFQVYDVYDLLHEKMKSSKKPVFPILPSIINVKDEIQQFIAKGHSFFPDEVVFGNALARVFSTPKPTEEEPDSYPVDTATIRKVIEQAEEGYISPNEIQQLLDAAGIDRAGEAVVTSKEQAIEEARKLGYPIVMKVVGPVHKSDVGGVVLNVQEDAQVAKEFERMIQIPETTAILMQPQLSGSELFVGAKREPKFGQMVLCGLGGIFIEVFKDTNAGLAPLSSQEVHRMISSLKGYKIIQGTRGQEPVNEAKFVETVMRISALVTAAPEIAEMDLNPLLGSRERVVAVDARIRIAK